MIGTAKAANKWYAVNGTGHIGAIDPTDLSIIESEGIGIEDLIDFGEAVQDKDQREGTSLPLLLPLLFLIFIVIGKWTTGAPIPDYYAPTVTWDEKAKEWHLKAIVYCVWPGLFHFLGSIDEELKTLHLVVGQNGLRYSEEVLLSRYKQGTALS